MNYLSKSEQDEMYDLKVIANNLTGGLLSHTSLECIQFMIDGKEDVNWVLDRLRILIDKKKRLCIQNESQSGREPKSS